MAALKQQVKVFLVQHLACMYSPTEAADEAKKEFGIDVTRLQAALYDPTTVRGSELGEKLKLIFYETRKKFLEDCSRIPIANKSYRLMKLQRNLEKADKSGNIVLANQILELAAKEEGGLFTNKVNLGSDTNTPLFAFYQQICGTSLPVVHDVEGEYEEIVKETIKPKKTAVITKKKILDRD
jgi:hypothetical protein